MLTANVQIIGDNRAVSAMLLRMDTALSPVAMAEFLGVTVDPYIRSRAQGRFDSEGDDVSGDWEPLSQHTIDLRVSQGFGAGPINVRTGELEDYITGTPGGVMPNSFGATLTSPGTPAAGTLLTKVKTAQGGKNYPPTPPRPVMGINEADTAYVLTALSGFIVRAVR